MRLLAVVMSVAVVGGAAIWAQTQHTTPEPKLAAASPRVSAAVAKGARWLASVQGADGGWGQDGGEDSSARPGERLESSGNDVANTAVAALALLQAGSQYNPQVERALAFVLQQIEASPTDGLAITNRQGTQIQRKLGPCIDTFLSSMLMSQLDGRASTPALNARVRKALQKTVAKIEKHQQSDGSWNIAGGWAPVLGTSMASRSLFEAQNRGVAVDAAVLKRAEDYTVIALSAPPPPAAPVAAGGVSAGRMGGAASAAPVEAAGVALYQSAQALEQLSRTTADRVQNAKQISAIQGQLSNAAFVGGFGSMGGEEFFSYLNISDSMKRIGGDAWSKWHADITQKILGLQNSDGTWAGHHCITGRVAMTSAAILNLTVDRAR
ncbi:MAG TPA: prenyltransferase/squalene oxidase repeat-containing protein [Vicinamibacterales bacterium]|nr:prenyltransferase/squalene oxidase repeat-containing protein [Vicinamibacterales bacterium]